MKRFLLSILCCLLAVVSGYAQGTDDFATYFTKTNTSYASGKTTAGWSYTNAAIVLIDDTYAPTINGKTSAKGTITSPTLTGGCGTLSLKYAYTYSESKGVSFKVTIKQGGKDVASYDVVNTTATLNEVYKWEQDVNIQGDFVIYITNNSPSNNSSKNKDRYSIWNIKWTAYGQASVPQLDAPVFTPSSCTFTTETFDVSIKAEDDATIYYTLDGSDPTKNSDVYDGVITLTETTTVKAIAIKGGYENSDVVEETYTKKEIIEGQVEDIITIDLIGETGNSYTSWTDKKSNSTAVYAGQSISNTDNIQLRSDKDNNNNYSGIVTTTSGGKVKKVIVEWNSLTTNNTRELNVYCSNNPYSTPNDLYAEATNGDLIGSIKKSGATELSIDGDYQYVGLRSKSGAIYINSITIIWETEEPTSDVWGSLYYPHNIDIPEGVKVYYVSAANTNSVTLTQITGTIPANTGVIYNGVWTAEKEPSSNKGADVIVNLLEGTVDATIIFEEAYVLAKVNGIVGFYKAEMNQSDGTAFLNNAYKAYLPVSALPTSAQNAKALKFDFGTTGVEGVKVETEGKKVIYDLSGRRVNDMTAPGLYIVNGKKVLVK